MPDSFKILNDRKFLWDGEIYESESAANEVVTKYRSDGFETKLLAENDKYLVYTRRVVTDVKVEGET